MQNKEPIAKYRKQAGLTLDEAARRFGVNRSTFIRWEKGVTKIPHWRLKDAEEILSAPRRDLRPDIFEGAA